MKKKNITICINEDTNEKLSNLAIIYNRSKSNLVETLINIEYKNCVCSGTYEPLIVRKELK